MKTYRSIHWLHEYFIKKLIYEVECDFSFLNPKNQIVIQKRSFSKSFLYQPNRNAALSSRLKRFVSVAGSLGSIMKPFEKHQLVLRLKFGRFKVGQGRGLRLILKKKIPASNRDCCQKVSSGFKNVISQMLISRSNAETQN